VGSLLAWSVQHRLPIFFAGSRRLAAATVLKLLSKWFFLNVRMAALVSAIAPGERETKKEDRA
jgi:hypothetical protein